MFNTNNIDISGKFGDPFVESVGWNFLGTTSYGIIFAISIFDLISSFFIKNDSELLNNFKPNIDLLTLEESTGGNLEYKLSQDSKNGLENNNTFRKLMILFAFVFSILIIFIDSATNKRSNNEDFLIFFWVILFIWIPFYVIYQLRIKYKSLLLQKLLNYKIELNRNGEYFFKGATNNSLEQDVNRIYFDSIYAVQVLEKIINGRKGYKFYYFEINLVLKDKTRINIIEASGDYRKDKVKIDAKKIGELLGVPVWDISSDL